jgi:putative transposase
MKLIANQLYHIYNQGNNQETIFFNEGNYLEFLLKFKENVLPHCEVLAYCLMPNHFHFLLNVSGKSIQPVKIGSLTLTNLSNGFRLLQSGYASYLNRKQGRSGVLFRPKIKAKVLQDDFGVYSFTCFQYIHQNPWRANLVEKLEDWRFSSFQEYMNEDKNGLCDRDLTVKLLDINLDKFYEESYQMVDANKLDKIWLK